ncbi:Dihydrolipoyllysine-residue succinyltransferase component of 2-oxoglutarate dehydrogenase complex 2 [Nymphaea thermarum]|nr:Dihydrolipoyllysine-residue succinyltransferase component of 2-oxoglutarate dehydrogenase complex 2 [Nymphaea thermarum]
MLEHLVRKVGRSGSFSTISALVHGKYLHRTVAEWPVLQESTGAEFVAKEGDTVVPGTKVAIISKSGIADSDAPASKEKSIEEVRLPSSSTDRQNVEKSKPVEAVVRDKPSSPSPPPSKASPTEPQLPPKERERRVPMTRLRKRVATRLKDSQNTYAMLSTINEVDMLVSEFYINHQFSQIVDFSSFYFPWICKQRQFFRK